jgi:dipeptide/tripeptide permease
MRYLYRTLNVALGLGVAWFSFRFLSQDGALQPMDVWGFLVYLVVGCGFIWDGVSGNRRFLPASRASGLIYVSLGGVSAAIGVASLILSRPLDRMAGLAVAASLVAALVLITQGRGLLRPGPPQEPT